ncbi:hypothetical protein OG21DRAFT_1421778 [Imleria badia]|nr:hypothetical protein OG21DRAFT_1421778 [Imleria badia]
MQALKSHLLSRLLGLDYDGDESSFTSEQRSAICLTNLHLVVESKLLRINYTTYDIRWDHDTIRTSRGDVVMTSSRDEDHPFWYARVIRAWHGIQAHFCPDGLGVSSSKRNMEVLWVRWLGIDEDHRWGFKEGRLPKIGFVPDCTDHSPFGFLDPSLVIRGYHLIPAPLARLPGENDDWAGFYVNIFADRDMFARFAGIGVGHLVLDLGGYVPALVINTLEDMDKDNEDDMQGIIEGQVVDEDHAESVHDWNDEDKDDGNGVSDNEGCESEDGIENDQWV